MKHITIYSSINDVKNGYYISVDSALERIRTGKSQSQVEKIRKASKDKGKVEKLKLPAVCFSGTFKTRAKMGVISHSGFICLDFDNCPDVNATKEVLKASKYIYSCWISPSGNGVKALVKIPADIDKHEMYFESLKEEFADIDISGKDISRACFESYDPDIYINVTADTWDKLHEKNTHSFETREPMAPITDEAEIIELIKKIVEKKYFFGEGNRNAYINDFAFYCNQYGISQDFATSYLCQFAEKGFSDTEIKKTIISAYKNTVNFGTWYFENQSIHREVRNKLQQDVNKREIIKSLVEKKNIPEEKAAKIVEDQIEKLHNVFEVFWKVIYNNKGNITKVEFVREKFIRFLQENGIFKYKVDKNYQIFVRIQDNIIEEYQPEDIQTFVFDWVQNLPDEPFDGIDKHYLYEFLSKGIATYFSEKLLNLIKTKEIIFNKDTESECYLYYINGVVKINKDDVILLNYSDINGSVWRNKIIQRHIVLVDQCEKNTYSKFLRKICNTQKDQEALYTTIGYLCHRYKDKKLSRVPILTDMQSSENAEGGSGKGLIVDGIKQLRNVITLDGKTFSPHKNFAFQRVNIDTDIIFIDDIARNFNFENLFSIITEGLAIEKKGLNEFYIQFEDSPKLVISTNYYVRGTGSSFDRRKIDVEINNYFTAKHTPFDEFKETIFNSWDADTWNDFDNTMFDYIRLYFMTGIVSSENENLNLKKLQSNTSYEFVEFMNAKSSSIDFFDSDIDRKRFLMEFVDTYGNWNKLSIKLMMKWLEIWSKHHGHEFTRESRRSGNDFYFKIRLNEI